MSGRRWTLWAAVLAAMLLGGCKGDTKENAKDAAEEATRFLKVAGDGIAEGIEKSRKETPSADGAAVVSTHEELARYAGLSVLAVRAGSDPKTAAVELAVHNRHTAPLRLIGLEKTGAVVLVDTDGFSTPLDKRDCLELLGGITILPSAKQKLTLRFGAPASKAAAVMIFGNRYPVPRGAASRPAKP